MASTLVTVVGDALLDVRVAPASAIQHGADVPAAVDVRPGGQGSNIAVRLARRGVRTRLVSRLGDDVAGELLHRTLVADGVELLDIGGPRTGAVVVLLDPDGERTMLSERVPLLGGWLDPAPAAEAGWLVVSGYVLTEPGSGLSASGTAPRRVIAGCALDPSQVAGWAAAADALAPDLVVLNHGEASVLAASEAQPDDLCRALAERFGAVVVVTHAAGAAAALPDGVVLVERELGSPARDTTGAGDAFTAALVTGLLDGDWLPHANDLRAAMAAACEVAAAVTAVDGAQGRIPGEDASG